MPLLIPRQYVEDLFGERPHYPRRDADRELFRDAGLAILSDETVVQHEPEGDLPFHWMLARKSDALALRH